MTDSSQPGTKQTHSWISVNGTGVVSHEPSSVVASLLLVSTGDNPGETYNSLTQQSRQFLEFAGNLGITGHNISTAEMNVRASEHWEEGRGSVLDGYLGEHRLSVKIPLSSEGTLSSFFDTFSETLRLENLKFAAEDELQARYKAEELAFEQAKASAENLAKQAGLSLGVVLNIAPVPEHASSPIPVMYAMASSENAVAPREQNVSASVQVTFALV